jgi:uncharacterized protein
LKGRDEQLDQIDKALSSPGRNCFVYGERGVGKTSLAQTAAYLYQSSDGEPETVACQKDVSFYSLIKDACEKLLKVNPIDAIKESQKTKIDLKYLSWESRSEFSKGKIPIPSTVNECIGLVQFCAKYHSKSPIVIIDETDRIADRSELVAAGDFIKQLGDQDVDVKFIFCGIGESLDHLLGGHESCYRYLASIYLERLTYKDCKAIIQSAADQFDISVPDGQLNSSHLRSGCFG